MMTGGKGLSSGGKKKNTRKRKYTGFKSSLYKVLKQVHPDAGASQKAMTIMDNFTCDMLRRLGSEAASLARMNKKKTISSREIQSATNLVLRGELSKHAVSEGTKAVVKYNSAQAK